ncbi:hypothetical protein cyc_00137 [Cyclospora cayetanensis]|uniref:Uncharacterized protein n=1 Tax=Cyclospora cayetanensis TaxID=88456 RepID=A0A1D3D9Y9_9EIME|nr:hypothetical protein cyc_00137 [Cyclospora cayetanensis]
MPCSCGLFQASAAPIRLETPQQRLVGVALPLKCPMKAEDPNGVPGVCDPPASNNNTPQARLRVVLTAIARQVAFFLEFPQTF